MCKNTVAGGVRRSRAAAVEGMAAMTGAELQARGWGAPPYHPCCRGYLILPDDSSGAAE
jgi:hypothetical protein